MPSLSESILVTGGAGFIGSNFILDWMEGDRGPVINLDKLTYAGNPRNLAPLEGRGDYTLIQGDICDAVLVERILREHRPQAVVHLAAESHVDRSILGPDAFLRTNVDGTFTLLQAARTFVSGLKGAEQQRFRFLHVSTDEVYGSLGPGDPAFHEGTAYSPRSPYAASKAASDHLARAWAHTYGLPVLVTNCSNNYGPNQFPEKLIPLMITHALAGKPLPIYGDGLQVRDWLYVRDHARALRAVLERGRAGETYNIGGDNQRSNLEVVTGVCELLDELVPESPHRPHRQLMRSVEDRPGHDRRYAIDARKIAAELGWRPSETFATGLRKTVAWYLANTAWVTDVTSGAYQDWVRTNYAGRGAEDGVTRASGQADRNGGDEGRGAADEAQAIEGRVLERSATRTVVDAAGAGGTTAEGTGEAFEREMANATERGSQTAPTRSTTLSGESGR